MPNWCNNELQVSGPAEDLAKFKQQAVGHSPWGTPAKDEKPSRLNFHNLVPVPEHILKLGYVNAGYDWEVKHWGARWGACDVELGDESELSICYHFDTAWAPAVPFVENACKKWPSLQFILDYDEPGMAFKGICKGAGEHFENHRIDY